MNSLPNLKNNISERHRELGPFVSSRRQLNGDFIAVLKLLYEENCPIRR